ncbi:hypothetical protein EVA_09712 [gut metagenome]|uniref:Uncharacterized protein n=1 Tax=gut metagenome TaxID=749906 RepID=J9CPW3_9ZZZZ
MDIFVADTDYQRAIEVLKQNYNWQEEQKYCPFCGSSDIRLVWKKGHRCQAVGSLLLSFLSVTPLKEGKYWEYKCRQCHKQFDYPVSQVVSSST